MEEEAVNCVSSTIKDHILGMNLIGDYISDVVEQRLKRKEDPYESDDTKEIATALAKAQGEFASVRENNENPYFKSRYANLDDIVKSIKPMFAKNGLSFTQQQVLKDGETILKTRLRHSSGQWIESRVRILPPKNDIQSYASTLTYMKRYALSTLIGITSSDDDDDGEISMSDVRATSTRGTSVNLKYNPKEQSFETITKEQREELEYELSPYPDIATQVLEGLKIQHLADMPKNKFQQSINRIREIKTLRDGRNVK